MMARMPEAGRFAQKLRASIEAQTRSQSEIARSVGLSPQMLSAYLGGSTPKPYTIALLADELTIDLHWLLDDADQRPAPVRPEVPANAAEIDVERWLVRSYLPHSLYLHDALSDYEDAVLEPFAIGAFAAPPARLDAQIREGVEDMDRLLSSVIMLQNHFAPTAHRLAEALGETVRYDVSADQLDKARLLDRFHQLRHRSLGFSALIEMVSLIPMAKGFTIINRHESPQVLQNRERYFEQYRRPYLLARLLNVPKNAEHPVVVAARAVHEQNLKRKGYLDRSGKPIAHPDMPDVPGEQSHQLQYLMVPDELLEDAMSGASNAHA